MLRRRPRYGDADRAGIGSRLQSIRRDDHRHDHEAEFVKQGNAICAAGNKEIEAGFESFAEKESLDENQRPTNAQIEEIATTVLVPAITEQVEELRELEVPAGDEDQVDEILTGAEEAIEEAEEDPGALADENSTLFTDVNEKATAYGLTVCGEEG